MSGHILVDGNAVAHAFHRSTRLTVGDFETQAIFGVVKAVRELQVTMPDRLLYVLWDGKAEHRYVLFPEYKGNRKPKTAEEEAKKHAYKRQIPLLQSMLGFLGVRQLLNYKLEADDLAGWLVNKLDTPLLLVTGDRDWLQLLRPGVQWFDPRNEGKTVVYDDFFAETGYRTPHAFLQGKALQGDNSDNIPGVGGIGEKGAAELLAEFGSVEAFHAHISTLPRTKLPKVRARFLDSGYEIFQRNMRLMNLLDLPQTRFEDYKQFTRVYDPEKVRMICDRLAFMSILKDFDNFVRPFQERA